jgi:pyruvate dehydrogenase (quinone)
MELSTAMSKRVADLLVDTLQAAGVKTCYGIVGDTLNRIAHANVGMTGNIP